MKQLSTHLRLVRMACLPALLVLSGCGGKLAPGPEALDLGGGISMTADGQILGATRPWSSSVPPDEGNQPQGNTAMTAASDYTPFPPGAPTPLFFSSAAQWSPPSADQTSVLKTPID